MGGSRSSVLLKYAPGFPAHPPAVAGLCAQRAGGPEEDRDSVFVSLSGSFKPEQSTGSGSKESRSVWVTTRSWF
ncbi:hypothetical protein VZT92_018103 [Zoarces viviparus]|uniref:Uncharacterized protein n=1 Tax=Zoarces viviparus TaxID=48416 RepID=A0AAW1ENS1_ZOAVI